MAIKDGKGGRKITRSLFLQFNHEYKDHPDWEPPIYDLDQFRETFLSSDDMTEYKAACALVGTWHEWMRIKRDWPYFSDLVEQWKIELEQKIRSKAMLKLIELIDGECADSVKAGVAKFLVQSQWNKADVGRPSKAEQRKMARELAKAAAETEEEAARISSFIIKADDLELQ